MTDLQDKSDNHKDLLYLLGFLLANLALKLGLVHFNGGSYTDGIIQLQSAEFPPHGGKYAAIGLYPPFFGDCAWLLSLAGLNLETAGRAVSAIAGSLALIPVFCLSRLLFGRDAARIAALLFTLSPLVLRWSGHVMTDSLFLALSASSLYFCVRAWSDAASAPGSKARMDSALAWASGFAALATHTRYQGVLLLAPLSLASLQLLRKHFFPVRTIVLSCLWLAPATFIIGHSGVHAGQFASRTAGALVPTLSAYWNTFESFILVSPYYFGYPIVALAIFGTCVAGRGGSAVCPFAWMAGLWTLLLLGVHAAFGSFQYRYMLPILPAILALAGHGAHQLYLAAKQRGLYPLYSLAMLVSLTYLALFAVGVLVFQRNTFADQKQAALYVKQHAAPGDPVFSNERYGSFTELGSVKLSFWSGRKVELVYDAATGRLKDLPNGALVLLGNHYGSNQVLEALAQQLGSKYSIQPVGPTFTSRVIPLMDDIMVDPLFNQNPMGWVLRYTPQMFYTRVVRVTGPAATAH